MPDDDLADEMRTVAEGLSGNDPRLDFSVKSLGVVDSEVAGGPLSEERRADLAAYLGE